MSERRLTVPFDAATARSLKLGEQVRLTGEILATAGYPTHQRIARCIERGEAPPLPLDGQALFHMGSMSRMQGNRLVPLYVNPTTSTRFNAFLPAILRRHGITALAGKGGLDQACAEAMQELGCVYFSMVGGAAPLLTEGVKEVLATGWDDLIAQFRLSRLRLEEFGPLTVAIDAHGNSLYRDLTAQARDRLPQIMAMLKAAREG